jgi:hypothetical protein
MEIWKCIMENGRKIKVTENRMGMELEVKLELDS